MSGIGHLSLNISPEDKPRDESYPPEQDRFKANNQWPVAPRELTSPAIVRLADRRALLQEGIYDVPKSLLEEKEQESDYDIPRPLNIIPKEEPQVRLRRNKTPPNQLNMGGHFEDWPLSEPTTSIDRGESELHYLVENTLYAKPSVKARKATPPEKTAKITSDTPTKTLYANLSVKARKVIPPELPPRNTPSSPDPRCLTPLEASQGQTYFNALDVQESRMINMESISCARCENGFEPRAKIVNSNGDLFHPQCFVCAQCFRSFPDGVFYEFEARKYCEHCFHVLYAPCCGKCGEFIIGRVIKAMGATWHPQCFTCEMCSKELADLGFTKNQGRALCHDCNAKVKAQGAGKHMCQKCHSVIDGDPLRFRGEVYHPYHFNCAGCSTELTSTAREVRTRPGYTANELNELYCLRCHDKMGIPICGACRRPIEERVVTALGKHWHVEHFVCAKCEKPFLGNRHYERKGLAYCETHYHQLFGNLCYVCNLVIQGDVFTALNKAWCVNHFACSSCDQKMTVKTKFYEVDLKPVCKKCYDKYPRELRLRLKKYHENEAARDQIISPK